MRFFYLCAAVFLLSLFVFLIFRPIMTIYHEEDLSFLLPSISYIAENNSFLGAVKIFLFDPYPTNWGEPTMNLYLFFIFSLFGSNAAYFIFISLIIHFSCAVLLYLLLIRVGFEFKTSFLAALMYAFMFIHFDYYIFTMAHQHLAVIFFSLLVLNLYLKTTQRIDRGERWKPYFWLTLFINFLASFCQAAILVLPASILVHILICSKDREDRIKKYDIWLPLFITYLGYQLIRFLYYGCLHLVYYLHMRMENVSIYSVAVFPIAFISALAAMFVFRLTLKLYDVPKFRNALKIMLILAIVIYLAVFFAASCKRELLIGMPHGRMPIFSLLSPYNLIRPLVGMFETFLEPLKAASLINSTSFRNYIPIQNNPVIILLVLLFILVFIKICAIKHKGVVTLVVFYLIALRSMTEFVLWDNHGTVPSRYFVYVTPFFSIFFSSVFVYLYYRIVDKARLRKATKDIILILLFAGLCLPNILAVKYAMFKIRLLDTRYIYDYIRISELVKGDLRRQIHSGRFDPGHIYIDGVVPMPFGDGGDYDFSPAKASNFDNFRYVFAQALNDRRMLDINVNRLPDRNGEGITYKIEDIDITDARDMNIDEFSRDRNEAARELRLKHYDKAAALFQKALERRPFLFRYILAGYELEDSPWVTNGRSMRQWVGGMTNYANPRKKLVYVFKVLNTEIDDYIECLFYASHLKYLAGKDAESAYLFSQIRFLDSDPKAVSSLLKGKPGFAGVEALTPSSRPDSRRSSFAKFISGLLVNKDVFK